jgi:hypothetical protein
VRALDLIDPQAAGVNAAYTALGSKGPGRPQRPEMRETHGAFHGVSPSRTHWRLGQQAVPRGHDVRRLGNKDHDESIRIIHRALDAGINFIDTADIYSQGESEVIVGKALAGGRRDDIVLASKAHMPMGDDPNRRGNSRHWIIREVEDSLRRLGTNWIDLYQIRRYDPDTDIDDTLGALTEPRPRRQEPSLWHRYARKVPHAGTMRTRPSSASFASTRATVPRATP